MKMRIKNKKKLSPLLAILIAQFVKIGLLVVEIQTE